LIIQGSLATIFDRRHFDSSTQPPATPPTTLSDHVRGKLISHGIVENWVGFAVTIVLNNSFLVHFQFLTNNLFNIYQICINLKKYSSSCSQSGGIQIHKKEDYKTFFINKTQTFCVFHLPLVNITQLIQL